jgi:multidrug efflux pump subunit AcrA (membrane-fusion protein)
MNSKRLIIYSFLLLFFCSCKGKTPANQPEEALNPTRNAQNIQATEVVTTLIQTAPFYYRVEATGKMESLNDYTVAASTGGMLEKLYVKTGGYVSAGAVMAQFSQTLVQLKIERAKLQVFNAEKEFESQMPGYEKLLQGLSEKEKADIWKKKFVSSGLAPALQVLKKPNTKAVRPLSKHLLGE